MAQVTFTIAAVDKTRGAFASINQGLRNLVSGGDATERRFVNMGLKAAGLGSVIALVGSQVRRVAEDIRSVPGVSEDVIRSWDQLRARTADVGSTLQNMVANAGHGLNSLANIIRYGFMEALFGSEAAQKDLLENEKALAEAAKINSGYYDKLAESTQRLMKARLDLKHIGEGEGASISRRRQEAAALEQRAKGMADEIRQNNTLAQATELRVGAEKDFQKILEEGKRLTTDVGIANSKLLGQQVPLKERIEGLEAAWARLNHELFATSESQDPQVLEKRNELLRQQKETADQLTKAYEEQNRRAAEASRVITSGFEDAVFAGASLREMIRGIGQDLLRYIFRQTITNSIGGFLTSGIGSLFGFKGPSPTADLALASGGPFAAGNLALVGENGPEIAAFGAPGRIIPNHMIASAAGGGGNNTYFIDARGTDESVVARLSAALMQLAGPGVVERRAIGAVGEYRMRGAMV